MNIKSRPSAAYAASLFGMTTLLLVLSREVATAMENRYVAMPLQEYTSPLDDLPKGATLRSAWTAKLTAPCIVVFSAGCHSCSVFAPEALEKNRDGLPIYFATRENESSVESSAVKAVTFGQSEVELFKLWLTPRAYVLDQDHRLSQISPSGLEVPGLVRFISDVKR